MSDRRLQLEQEGQVLFAVPVAYVVMADVSIYRQVVYH